jgi:glycosyltransferase involved in cell wall biosynthesis
VVISILCPTRGRPDNIRRLVASAVETAADQRFEFVFYVDDDDPASVETLAEYHDTYDRVTCITGERVVLSQMWNVCFAHARGDVLMHCGDDIVFRSPGWDRMVLDAFDGQPDRILFVHGRDGVHDANFGTHGFIHRRWVETVGYFVPPYFSSDWNDTWLNDVANMLGRRRFLPDLYTEHMHPVVGKAEWDLTHQERMARHTRDNVDVLYASLAQERAEDAEKLGAVMR